jgi:hypothetical protein
MATLAVWDDWWVAILDMRNVDLGPSPSMPRVRVMGTSYRVRLGWRATTVAIVNCESPGRDRSPDRLEIQWLRPEAAFPFNATARSWWATLSGVDPDADVATVRSNFTGMLVRATAELQRWPGVAVGTSPHDPQPGPGVESEPSVGAVRIGGATHYLTGWVDGHLFYTGPDGREFEVTSSRELVEKIMLICASHFGVAPAG